ncbi:MAG: hypothetical protein M3Q03_09765 [Chloroflexota bacterium]|nr:hypothetical protein [Chloroflexota bacterium]
MNAVYDLYNMRTRNLVGTYGSEDEALRVVREWNAANGPAYTEPLVLTSVDQEGRT